MTNKDIEQQFQLIVENIERIKSKTTDKHIYALSSCVEQLSKIVASCCKIGRYERDLFSQEEIANSEQKTYGDMEWRLVAMRDDKVALYGLNKETGAYQLQGVHPNRACAIHTIYYGYIPMGANNNDND